MSVVLMPADDDIGGAYVCRTFFHRDELMRPPRHLFADEVLAIPIRNRRALVERGYLWLYSSSTSGAGRWSGGKPPWDTPNERTKAALAAWTSAELDVLEAAEQDTLDYERALRNLAKLPPEVRRAALERTGLPIAVDRWSRGDSGPWERLAAKGRIQAPPPSPSDWRKRRLRRERADLRLRKMLAVADYHRILDIWAKKYGRRQRTVSPRAAEIAAARHDLDEAAVKDALKHS